jgi:hypothetical protein
MWQLPSSPDSPVYEAVLDDIRHETDPTLAAEKFRAVAEADYYFFVKYASTFGHYQIKDPDHREKGGWWIDQAFCFDLCRLIQQDIEQAVPNASYFFARGHFKTELCNKLPSIWLTLKDPWMTTCILTYKVDQMGEMMFRGLMEELERNAVLIRHWPDRLAVETKEYPLWTNSACTIKRPPGPKEPSFSIHSLDKQPTSGHYRRIVFDDTTIKQTVESRQTVRATVEAIRLATALRSDDTLSVHIGTIWDADDPNVILAREGFFSRWDPTGCYDKAGTPVLRSKKQLAQWEREMGPYVSSCQLHLVPVAKGEQSFDQAWLEYYTKPPKDEALGKIVHFFCDFTLGIGEDYGVISVQGLGMDRHRYHLDLSRERERLMDQFDRLFSLVARWHPHCVWLEDKAIYQQLQAEQNRRSFRFRLQMVPDVARQRPKEARIQELQGAFSRKEHIFPKDGFGHGSKADRRDTLHQFLEDEYRFWTPLRRAVLNDDMLDAMAWVDQPEVRPVYPQNLPEQMAPKDLFNSWLADQMAGRRHNPSKHHSAWVD